MDSTKQQPKSKKSKPGKKDTESKKRKKSKKVRMIKQFLEHGLVLYAVVQIKHNSSTSYLL